MNTPWTTRSGDQPSQRPSDAPKPGADFAALVATDTGGRERERESAAAARRQAEEERRKLLERNAQRARRNERLRAMASSRTIVAAAVGLLLVAAFATVILPMISKALDPPLSHAQLSNQESVLSLQAAKALHVRVSSPKVSESNDVFTVKYTARKGQRDMDGKRIRSGCSVTFIVDRAASAPDALAVRSQSISRTCRVAK